MAGNQVSMRVLRSPLSEVLSCHCLYYEAARMLSTSAVNSRKLAVVRHSGVNKSKSMEIFTKKFLDGGMAEPKAVWHTATGVARGAERSHRFLVSKTSQRRLNNLNQVLYESINDIIVSGVIGSELAGRQFTVSKVKVLEDMAGIRVYWFCLNQQQVLEGAATTEQLLEKASANMRQELVNQRIAGFIPKLTFIEDTELNNVLEVEEILTKIRKTELTSEEEDPEQVDAASSCVETTNSSNRYHYNVSDSSKNVSDNVIDSCKNVTDSRKNVTSSSKNVTDSRKNISDSSENVSDSSENVGDSESCNDSSSGEKNHECKDKGMKMAAIGTISENIFAPDFEYKPVDNKSPVEGSWWWKSKPLSSYSTFGPNKIVNDYPSYNCSQLTDGLFGVSRNRIMSKIHASLSRAEAMGEDSGHNSTYPFLIREPGPSRDLEDEQQDGEKEEEEEVHFASRNALREWARTYRRWSERGDAKARRYGDPMERDTVWLDLYEKELQKHRESMCKVVPILEDDDYYHEDRDEDYQESQDFYKD